MIPNIYILRYSPGGASVPNDNPEQKGYGTALEVNREVINNNGCMWCVGVYGQEEGVKGQRVLPKSYREAVNGDRETSEGDGEALNGNGKTVEVNEEALKEALYDDGKQ